MVSRLLRYSLLFIKIYFLVNFVGLNLALNIEPKAPKAIKLHHLHDHSLVRRSPDIKTSLQTLHWKGIPSSQ